jgi:1-hydroxy-2-naphthoate dioxygenase
MARNAKFFNKLVGGMRVFMAYEEGEQLAAFDAELAEHHMRGQWTSEDLRDQGQGGCWKGDIWEPYTRGEPCVWHWADTEPLLEKSCEAIQESFTARRSLLFNNPGLPRSSTHTLNMGIQLVKPGETAWSHRHSISAIRFVIEGHDDLFTVVNGETCPMQDSDLVLTPSLRWHDHNNLSDGRALWLDVLDGPLVSALNQTVFENYGEKRQPMNNHPGAGGLHFPWTKMEAQLRAIDTAVQSPHDGFAAEYLDPATGSPVMPTIGCTAQILPPGFKGAAHRHSSSTVYFVVRGAGQSTVGEKELVWGERDCFVIPAWDTHSHTNRSNDEEAILFSASDAPALRALGLYSESPVSTD